MKNLAIVTALFFFLSVTIAADSYYFSPLKAGGSARQVRLGQIVGHSDRADAVFGNPASLYKLNRFSSSFFQTKFMEEVLYQNMAVAARVNVGIFQGVVGIGFMNAGVDNIIKTAQYIRSDGETQTVAESTFNYQNSLLTACYQFTLFDALHMGVAGNYYYSDFDTVSAAGSNVNIGALLEARRFNVSILMRNIMASSREVLYSDTESTDTSSDGKTEKLSLETIYSLQYKWTSISVLGQLKTVGAERNLHKMLAVEYSPYFIPFLRASIGRRWYPLTQYTEGDVVLETKRATTLGFELDILGLDLNYAYERSDHIEYNHKHYFSVGFSF